MSLIADALKRAQEQRSAGQTDDKARRMLTGAGPLRVETGEGPTLTRPLALGLAAVMVAAAVLVGSIIMTPTASAPGSGQAPATEPGSGGNGGWLSAATSTGSLYATPSGGEGVTVPEEDVAEDGGSGSSAWTGRTSTDGGTGGDARDGGAPDVDRSDGAAPGAGRSRREAGGVAPEPRTDPGTGSVGRAAVPPARSDAGSSFRITVRGGAQERTAENYFVSALSAHQSGNLVEAATLYRSAIDLRPGDAELWNNLGAVYRRLARPEDALAAFRSAVEAMPSYAPAWSNLGLVLEGLGRDGEAIDAYREALRQDPDNAGAKVNLANKYHSLGMPEQARTLLREVLREDPSLPEAHYALARVLEDDGELAEAERHYRLFLEVGRGQFPVLERRVAEHLSTIEGSGL